MPDVDLWEKMATPSRLGMTIGPEFMGRKYVPYPWLLRAENRILDAVADPEPRFIVLNVPPQWGKTTYSGMLLPAWYLGMYPHHQVLFITYAQEYSETWGAKTRNLLAQYGPSLFGVGVSKAQTSAADWTTSQGFGGMKSVGILGGITGRSGNLIIVDDVIKTMEEASSITTKRKHLTEWDGAISSRIQERVEDQPGSTVIITATRFAEDDLSGSLIERMDKLGYAGDQWEVISIPALAEPPEDLELEDEELAEWTDFLGRHAGEGAVCRYSQRYYEQKKASIDPFTWSAVYQQRPSVSEGGMFPKENWRFWNQGNLPDMVRRVRVWDLAATEGAGDHTVGSLWGLGVNGDIFLLQRHRFRRNSAEVERMVKQTALGDGYEVKILIEQEKAGAGKSLVEHYQRMLSGYMVEAAKIDGAKEVRARPYSAMQNNQRVWLPEHDMELRKSWISEHNKMMGDGRRPRHDDQIDTGAYAVLELIGQGEADLWIPGNPDDPASAIFAEAASVGGFRGQTVPDRVRAFLSPERVAVPDAV